ncbi:MAG: DUF2848 family protein [Fretibacterium sp.]|nr:DUF2848 family protein [Fretibacterium sp.]
MKKKVFELERLGGTKSVEIAFDKVFAIGYAGRDTSKTMAHIKELEEQLGVPAPARIPTIFQCSVYTLRQEENIEFLGSQTCGEVEYVIVTQGEKLYIGLGSDHTDRKLESVSVPKAKQICAKPLSRKLWDYDEVKDHWDEIALRSWQMVDGEKVLYQDGGVRDILSVEDNLRELRERVGDIDNAVIFSGTVPLLKGFLYGEKFFCEMVDPRLDRNNAFAYSVEVIPEEER